MVTVSLIQNLYKDKRKKPPTSPTIRINFKLIEKCYKGFVVLSPKKPGKSHETILLLRDSFLK